MVRGSGCLAHHNGSDEAFFAFEAFLRRGLEADGCLMSHDGVLAR